MKQSQKNIRPLIPIIAGLGFLLIALAVIMLQTASPQKTSIITPQLLTDSDVYPEVYRISAEDAKAAYDQKSAVFVDTRDAGSFKRVHIPGAINIPSNKVEANLGKLNKSDWIITYCT